MSQFPSNPRQGPAKPYASIPRIDWTHPLADSLIFYAYDAGGVIYDLVSGGGSGKITTSTTHITRTISKEGYGLKYPGTATSDSVSLPLASKATQGFTNTAPFSAAVGVFGSVGVNNGYFTSTGDATTDVAGFTVQATTFGFNFNNGGSQVAFNTAVSANNYHTGVAVATSSTAATLYFDGKLDHSVTAITTTNATTSQQVNFNSGTASSVNFGGGWNGFVHYWAGWNRVLSAAEAGLLHSDPYCFLIYPEDEVFNTLVGVVAAAAALPFNTLWVPVTQPLVPFPQLQPYNNQLFKNPIPFGPYDYSVGPWRVHQTQIDLSRPTNLNLFKNNIPFFNFEGLTSAKNVANLISILQPYNQNLYTVTAQVPFTQTDWSKSFNLSLPIQPAQPYNQSLYAVTITLMGQAWI